MSMNPSCRLPSHEKSNIQTSAYKKRG
jgi:hypothetical protein